MSINTNHKTDTLTPSTGYLKVSACISTTSTTLASLPFAGVPAGSRAFITDALSPVFGSVAVSGGAVKVPVYWNGSDWYVG